MTTLASQLTLFDPPLAGLRLEPTEAMQRGDQRVYQCSWCGAVLVVPTSREPEHPCSACGASERRWWSQRFPVAGLVPA